MKTALLVALALAACALVAAPAASACPDPDRPCSPEPLDPPNLFCEPPEPAGGTGGVKQFLLCMPP